MRNNMFIDLTRTCSFNNPNERMVQATLDDFLNQNEKELPAVLNFLDLPLCQSNVALPIR